MARVFVHAINIRIGVFPRLNEKMVTFPDLSAVYWLESYFILRPFFEESCVLFDGKFKFGHRSELGDLATVIQTKANAIKTNQKTALLLNGWPRTIAETMATATKFMKFS